MKRMTDKTNIYEIIYKILQITLYFAVAGISVAYLIYLSIGQEKQILVNVIFTLLFAVFLLWQVDILVRKKLYKSTIPDETRDKKHTIAVCVALISGIICAVSYAVKSFSDLSGPLSLAGIILCILSILITMIALAIENSFSRKIKTEETSIDESNAEVNN